MLSIPNDRLTAAAEYTSRANREEWFGHFEVEYAADGRIGYRTTLLSETAEPGFAVLRDWLDTNWGTISLHTPFIQSVLFDKVSPTDALQALHDDLHKEA
jgi:hypothetical protein